LPKTKKSIVSINGEMDLAISKRENISNQETPPKLIKKRPDGFDYVEENYMRAMLDKLYPDWSWLPAPSNSVQFLGSEWIIVSGVLEITEEESGRKRRFFSPGAARVQFKSGREHTAENVIDIDNNVGSANTFAFKRAINRLTHIADDVYRKQIKTDFLAKDQTDMFSELIKDAEKQNMKMTRLAKWRNALKDDLYQSNFDDAYQTLLEEVEYLTKQKETLTKESK
jgi:hypothetical protein